MPDPESRLESSYRDQLREAWSRAGHPGWLARTWPYPGNERMRVYLALILRGVDWGDPDWPLTEEQRLFYEPRGDAPVAPLRVTPAGGPEDEECAADDYRTNSLPWWQDGLAGGICGLALALGAAISLGWIHL